MRCNCLSIVAAIHPHAEMLYPPLAAPLLLADPRAFEVASERLATLHTFCTTKTYQDFTASYLRDVRAEFYVAAEHIVHR